MPGILGVHTGPSRLLPEADWQDYFRRAVSSNDLEHVVERALWEMLLDPGTPLSVSQGGVEQNAPRSRPFTAWRVARQSQSIQNLWSAALLSDRYRKGAE